MPARPGHRAAVGLLLSAAISAVREEDGAEAARTTAMHREASAVEQGYLPGVHAQAVAEAFKAATAQCEPMQQLLEAYKKAGMRKKTRFLCRGNGCEGLGPTDCLEGRCLCQDGYGFDDRHCMPGYSRPLPVEAEDVVKTMLLAGVREPDEMPCPGDTLEEGTMGASVLNMVVFGEPRSEVSMCRMGVQVYHASALPLVKRDKLQETPLENGGSATDNAGADLYSVMTNRQWRTQAIQIMSAEFAYAIAMPDLSEAAKRLGNLFHTLGDSFSASHVVRESKDGEPSAEVCESLTVKMAMSMDVMNFLVHIQADMISTDLLFKCSAYYMEQTIKLWAQARQQQPANAAAVNEWVGRLVKKVLCPSLPMHPERLDMPAGGASAYYSAANSHGVSWLGRRHDVPTEPRGTVSDGDAQRIVVRWNTLLEIERGQAPRAFDVQRRFPQHVFLPGRSLDACKDARVAYVGEEHVQAARKGELPPQYLLPKI